VLFRLAPRVHSRAMVNLRTWCDLHGVFGRPHFLSSRRVSPGSIAPHAPDRCNLAHPCPHNDRASAARWVPGMKPGKTSVRRAALALHSPVIPAKRGPRPLLPGTARIPAREPGPRAICGSHPSCGPGVPGLAPLARDDSNGLRLGRASHREGELQGRLSASTTPTVGAPSPPTPPSSRPRMRNCACGSGPGPRCVSTCSV
jgi:hypothetical protein